MSDHQKSLLSLIQNAPDPFSSTVRALPQSLFPLLQLQASEDKIDTDLRDFIVWFLEYTKGKVVKKKNISDIQNLKRKRKKKCITIKSRIYRY